LSLLFDLLLPYILAYKLIAFFKGFFLEEFVTDLTINQ
jgi:hypothetical protein